MTLLWWLRPGMNPTPAMRVPRWRLARGGPVLVGGPVMIHVDGDLTHFDVVSITRAVRAQLLSEARRAL